MTDQSKLISLSKKIAAVGVIIAFLGTLGYNIDFRFALASEVEATQSENDDKHRQHEIRQLRAEWRYVRDRIQHAKEEGNTALEAELSNRLRDIERDIDAIENVG